jgi:hypothetical protein
MRMVVVEVQHQSKQLRQTMMRMMRVHLHDHRDNELPCDHDDQDEDIHHD